MRFSTTKRDLYENVVSLCIILDPPGVLHNTPSSVQQYRKTHPSPAHFHDLLNKGIYGSYDKLFISMATQIPDLTTTRLMPCIILVFTLQKLVDLQTDVDLNFTRALNRSVPFWRSLWLVMQNGDDESLDVHVAFILKIAAWAIHFHAAKDQALIDEERLHLVKTWIHSNFFEAMDKTLSQWSPECGIACMSSVILSETP